MIQMIGDSVKSIEISPSMVKLPSASITVRESKANVAVLKATGSKSIEPLNVAFPSMRTPPSQKSENVKLPLKSPVISSSSIER